MLYRDLNACCKRHCDIRPFQKIGSLAYYFVCNKLAINHTVVTIHFHLCLDFEKLSRKSIPPNLRGLQERHVELFVLFKVCWYIFHHKSVISHLLQKRFTGNPYYVDLQEINGTK